jgi:uncharacterized protein HemX
MSEKVVLPKFDLPGKQMHPAVKLLWMVGGLMVLSLLALGGALYRHHAQEVAEENRKQAEIAAKTAQANAEAEAAKARKAEADAKAEQAKAKIAEVDAAKKGIVLGDAKPTATAGRKHRSSSKGSKTTVATKGTADEGKKPSGGKSGGKKGDDVVDKLLASFK